MSKMTLYGIWLSGPTYKAGLALSLMGQPFAYKHVDLRAGAHKQPDYLAVNRYGQVPALVDGDLKLCHSGSTNFTIIPPCKCVWLLLFT